MKRKRRAFSRLARAILCALIVIVETGAFAQKASVPKPIPGARLSDEQVRQLLILMDTNQNGKISKQEWMKFMEAEFERLDKDHSGDLDATDLASSRLEPSPKPFAAAGK
jgi:EF hand